MQKYKCVPYIITHESCIDKMYGKKDKLYGVLFLRFAEFRGGYSEFFLETATERGCI